MNNTQVDPQILTALRSALLQAFEVQVSTKVEVSKGEVQSALAGNRTPTDIAAILGVASSRYTGTLVLGFDEKTFLGLVKRLIDEQFEKIGAENADCAGELLNIVFGVAKVTINETGHDFGSAIPSISFGKDILIATPEMSAGLSPTRLTCKSDLGNFYLDINLKKIPEGA